jgi:signal transduction histidine kinase
VDDLLDYARIEAGTFTLQLEEADMVAKVAEIVESLTLQAKEVGLKLTTALPDEPLALRMDAQRVGQVLINFLTNAIKFTPAGGAITVRLLPEADQVRCEVADTGPGIPEADRTRLFQRFTQLENGQKKGGTGLGLSIAKALVEAHGGAIGVDSASGEGSTFWFTLPK